MAVLFAGFSVVQAVTAGLAFLGLCNWSYMLIRMFVFIQWLVAFLGVARVGVMAFQLESRKEHIAAECWGAVNDKGYSPQGTAAAFYCSTPINTFIMFFIGGLVIDFVLNLYMYFVVWRFYVRMRLYPFQKPVTLAYDQGLYEM
ncbi:hypothetical protein BGX34_009705 [Mortierella sp. NVP85]|nr:hypothetical protein BGX34_009705 [Mortierella sp. NVP85]